MRRRHGMMRPSQSATLRSQGATLRLRRIGLAPDEPIAL
jgi:hypothetical protein